MKFKFIFLICLLCILNFYSFSQSAQELDKLALELMLKNKPYSALDKIKTAILMDSINPQFYVTRACIYENINNQKNAYNDIEKALALDSTYSFAYHHNAIFLFRENKFEESIKSGLIGLKYSKDDDSLKHDIYTNLGVASYFLKDYLKAVDYYSSALKFQPNNLFVLSNLASTQNMLGKKKDAIQTLEQILKFDSLNVPGLNNLGMRYIELGEYSRALLFLNKANTVSPSDGIIYNNISFCFFKLGQNEKALAFVNRSIELSSKNPYAFKNRALIYLSSKKTRDLACADLNKAEELGYSKVADDEALLLIKKYCK